MRVRLPGSRVRSERRNLLELSRIAQDAFVERLQTIPNVASVDIWGEKTYSMRLWIDPNKLAAYRLSPIDVRDAVARENVELPSGRIEGMEVELPVRTMSRLNTPEDFNDLILKSEGDRIIRLRDVGHAELGPRNERTVLKRDGVPMVLVVASPQPGANYIAIADEFKRRVEMIKNLCPTDVEVSWAFDASRYIRKSVAEVRQTILIAFGLVMFVIFLFLRDWRTTLIPVVVIPVSLIGSCFVMYLAGFTLNVLTLLALVLAIGLVVDDAIVVVEVIYAKIEAGLDPQQAGVEGTREIFFAVVATTVALVAVFMPILFLGGLVGRLFREFGVTLAGAVIISSFVALTLTPMLATRLLKKRARQPWLYRTTEPFFSALVADYRERLTQLLRRRWLAVPVVLVCLGLVALFLNVLPRELAPIEDRAQVGLNARGPEGATFAYMDRFMDRAQRRHSRGSSRNRQYDHGHRAGFRRFFVGQHGIWADQSGRTRRARADSSRDRKCPGGPGQPTDRRADLHFAATNNRRRPAPGPAGPVRDPGAEYGETTGGSANFPCRRGGRRDLHLRRRQPQVRQAGAPGFDRSRTGAGPRRVCPPHRPDSAARIERAATGLFRHGRQAVRGDRAGERGSRDETIDLRNLYVTTEGRPPVLLDKLVTVTETSSPPQIFRFDRYESATVSAALMPGKTIGDGIEAMQRIADEVLDDNFATSLAGESRDFAESSTSLLFVFVLALVLVYLVLAAQFESFRDPLIIMFTVPLALAGALFSLWYFNQTLNIFSQIGMIMLIGLVTKNGILIVEFANQRKAAGVPVTEAIIEGATSRFRPVLMTSSSTVLGILPIALGLGAGAESRIPMGVAVIGGLFLGTLLTLFVVPAMCSFLTSKKGRVQRFAEDV